MKIRIGTAVMILWIGSAVKGRGQEAQPPTLVGKIEMPQVKGRIDHFSADLQGRVLYLSALGNHSVEVLDAQKQRLLRNIPGIDEPQGVLYVPSSRRLFVASGGDGAVRVYDTTSFQLTATVRYSSDADNIRYDARRGQVVVGYGSGALGILTNEGKRVGDIPVDGHPESFQIEASGGRAFVNVPDSREIEVVDLDRRSVTARWPVSAARANFPMALDEAHHRLLVGCRSPARLLVLDTDSGKLVSQVEIAGDTDDLFYDAARGRAYVIAGEGFVDVIRQRDPGHYEHTARVPTAPGARTGYFAPDWNQLFVAAPRRGDRPAQVLVFHLR